MGVAVLLSGGRVTIPTDIRSKLGLREGDKVVFAERDGDVVISSQDDSNLSPWEELQKGFAGEAERVGWKDEEDVVNYCKEIRREMWEERYGHTG